MGLAEPVLVVTHKNPDADGISTVATLLNFLKFHGIEAYTRVEGRALVSAEWMYEPEDFCTDPVGDPVDVLPEAESIIVVDCQPMPDRLGFNVFDYLCSKSITVIDHHAGAYDKHNPEKGVWVEKVPSTGCVLIDHDIVHELLYVGLFFDTGGFKYNAVAAHEYMSKLTKLLEYSPWANEITQDLIDEYHALMMPKKHPDFLHALRECKVFIHEIGDEDLITLIHKGTDGDTFQSILEVAFSIGDTAVVIDQKRAKVSFRTSSDIVNVKDIAGLWGGGGHIQAAGCVVKDEYMTRSDCWAFVEKVKAEIAGQLGEDPEDVGLGFYV